MNLPMTRIASALVLFCSITPPGFGQYASLQVPKQIQYQGRVATAAGGAWAGTEGYFVFALVQGATVLWNNWQGTASPADPGTVSLGSGQVLTLPVNSGVFSIRLGDGSGTNQQIPATVFFDSTANAVRTGVKLAVWFSPDDITFTRLSPDVEFTAVPFAMVAGIAESVQARAVTSAMLANGAVVSNNIGVAAVAAEQIADSAVNSAKIVDGTIQAVDLAAVIVQALVPPGTILSYAGITAPPGFLMCNGDSYAKLSYPALAAVLYNGASGAAYGGSSTQFNVPDLRGRFLRGTDDPDGGGSAFAAALRDPDTSAAKRPAMNTGGNSGNAVGSVQGHAVQDHVHKAPPPSTGTSTNFVTSFQSAGGGSDGTDEGAAGGGDWRFKRAGQSATGAVNTSSATVATETRPINANVNYIIKF